MNWFMEFEEEVYLYGLMYYIFDKLLRKIFVYLKFGLINIDFNEIYGVKYFKELL